MHRIRAINCDRIDSAPDLGATRGKTRMGRTSSATSAIWLACAKVASSSAMTLLQSSSAMTLLQTLLDTTKGPAGNN